MFKYYYILELKYICRMAIRVNVDNRGTNHTLTLTTGSPPCSINIYAVLPSQRVIDMSSVSRCLLATQSWPSDADIRDSKSFMDNNNALCAKLVEVDFTKIKSNAERPNVKLNFYNYLGIQDDVPMYYGDEDWISIRGIDNDKFYQEINDDITFEELRGYSCNFYSNTLSVTN